MPGLTKIGITLIHKDAGASSRLAGAVSCLFVMVVFVCGGPLLLYIPLPVLGSMVRPSVHSTASVNPLHCLCQRHGQWQWHAWSVLSAQCSVLSVSVSGTVTVNVTISVFVTVALTITVTVIVFVTVALTLVLQKGAHASAGVCDWCGADVGVPSAAVAHDAMGGLPHHADNSIDNSNQRVRTTLLRAN